MAEILLKQAWGLGVLVLFGGLMALWAGLLPRLVDRWEPPPEPRGLPGADLPTTEGVATAPAPPPRFAPAVREAVSPPVPPVSEESLLAGAVGLALALYHQQAPLTPPVPEPGGPGASPWTLAGRVQAMQARRLAQKR